MKRIELAGLKFGRYTVVALHTPGFRRGNTMTHPLWSCTCDCGTERVVSGPSLRNGTSKSCGCYASELTKARNFKHGSAFRGKQDRAYTTWGGVKTRCTNSKVPAYAYYGGRGILMCDRWKDSFPYFLEDMGPCPEGYSIERINPNGNYEPGNCKWIPLNEQVHNRRYDSKVVIGSEVVSLYDLPEKLGWLRNKQGHYVLPTSDYSSGVAA